jgi:hypothetical protein
MRYPTRVHLGTTAMDLVLTADDVRESIRLNGAGDTTKCPGAICIQRHARLYAHLFRHDVVGMVDFTTSRLFIESRQNKLGHPIDCYGYEQDGKIPNLVDNSPEGLKRLLAYIEKHGPITFRIKPYRQRSKEGRPGRDRKSTGVRKNQYKKAKLRRLKVQLGLGGLATTVAA